MPIKSKVFIQQLQKSQYMRNISFASKFNNKNTKTVFGANLPPLNTIKLDLPPNTIRVKVKAILCRKPEGICDHFRGCDWTNIQVGTV